MYIGSYELSSAKTSGTAAGKFRKEEGMIMVYERSKVPEWMRFAEQTAGGMAAGRREGRGPGNARRLQRTERQEERRTA